MKAVFTNFLFRKVGLLVKPSSLRLAKHHPSLHVGSCNCLSYKDKIEYCKGCWYYWWRWLLVDIDYIDIANVNRHCRSIRRSTSKDDGHRRPKSKFSRIFL